MATDIILLKLQMEGDQLYRARQMTEAIILYEKAIKRAEELGNEHVPKALRERIAHIRAKSAPTR